MKKIILLIYLTIVFSNLILFAQERTITGKITASEDDLPLVGVNVSLKGITKGGVSDENEFYKINASSSATLKFSFVGFSAKSIPVNNQINVDVSLISKISDLDEVVITGYGAKLKMKETTGATVNINPHGYGFEP